MFFLRRGLEELAPFFQGLFHFRPFFLDILREYASSQNRRSKRDVSQLCNSNGSIFIQFKLCCQSMGDCRTSNYCAEIGTISDIRQTCPVIVKHFNYSKLQTSPSPNPPLRLAPSVKDAIVSIGLAAIPLDELLGVLPSYPGMLKSTILHESHFQMHPSCHQQCNLLFSSQDQ
jgi:hypothetical protein